MNKVIASGVEKENYCDVVNQYIEQLQKELDITLFEGIFGYYMYKGLVHEIRMEDDQIVDETYESWSVKEMHLVMNVLDDRIW